jgi:hypothetical protein
VPLLVCLTLSTYLSTSHPAQCSRQSDTDYPEFVISIDIDIPLTYMRQVGNQAFADHIDGANGHLTHINNKKDPIPILPGRFLGFHHSSGEIHIEDSNAWDNCPGQDNPSTLCSTGDVANVFEGKLLDHHGPYHGVMMGC